MHYEEVRTVGLHEDRNFLKRLQKHRFCTIGDLCAHLFLIEHSQIKIQNT